MIVMIQPFQYAAEYGHLEIVKFLLENGADLNGNEGAALSMASCNGHLDVVKFLIEMGVDIHADNNQALWWALMDN